MSGHHTPDDNNPTADAVAAFGFVVVPFALLFALGLQLIGGLPLTGGGGDHGGDHGGEHAAEEAH